jgi:hypothetical protein
VGATVVGQQRSDETVCVVLRRDVVLLGLPLPVEARACALAGVRP